MEDTSTYTDMFCTRTEFRPVDYPGVADGLVVGIDVGYSSVKAVSRSLVSCFPSFVRKFTGQLIGELDPSEIIYTDDDTGEIYSVGDYATKSLLRGQYVTEKAMYDRNHYTTPEFLAQFRCGIAFSMWNEPSGLPIYVETGLPPAYLKEDIPILRHVLEREHNFTVKRGKETKSFHFSLSEESIDIIAQPMGTLYSVSIDERAKITRDMATYLASSVLIFDGGFGTLDLFYIRNKSIESTDTNDQLGMRRVLDEARNMIKADYNMDISIPEMQTYLRTGKAVKRDYITKTTKTIDISGYMRKANRIICNEAYESIGNYIFDTDFLIMTGGTGAAWYHDFAAKLKDVDTIKVLPGNMQSSLPNIYANARGYFMSMTNTIRRRDADGGQKDKGTT